MSAITPQASNRQSPRKTAADYLARGWQPVPLQPREKKPQGKGWQNKKWQPANFSDGNNIGVILGEASNQLVDIDLDIPEARQIADELLGHLPSFGRSSAPRGHRLVQCPDLKKAIKQFGIADRDVASLLLDLQPGSDAKAMVLEVRAKGQTMFPDSIHPSGECVKWNTETPDVIPEMTWTELLNAAGLIAFLAVIARAYPRVPGNRDNICLALSGALVDLGLSDQQCDKCAAAVAKVANDEEAEKRSGKAQATREKKESNQPYCALPKLLEYLNLTALERDIRKWLGLQDKSANSIAMDGILMTPGEIGRIVNEAEAALLLSDLPIFQRGGELVRVTPIDKPIDGCQIRRATGSTVVMPIKETWLREKLASVIPWYRPNKSGMPKPADPDMQYVRTLLGRVGEWKFPVLRAVLNTPTIELDGRVIEAPGYDSESGFLLDIRPDQFPPVPNQPGKVEAEQSLAKLESLLEEYPFVNEAARSVALSALLTGLVRPSMRTSPLHAFDAPTPGTGKSHLAELVGLFATGRKLPAMSQGKNPEEDEKRLSVVLHEADRIVLIDNCERPVEGDFLCSMLTQENVQTRILGRSERMLLPSSALVLATGNNLTLAGDMTRRAVLCRLDASVEQPDSRQFKTDCHKIITENREALVIAGLTVLRAYLLQDPPSKLPPMGSFEDWNLVRSALVWLGKPDPASTRSNVILNDPRREEILDLLKAWWTALDSAPVTLNELHQRCEASHKEPALQDLHRKLIEISGKNSWNPKSIGWRLRSHKDRIINGFRLHSADTSGVQSWYVTKVESGQEPIQEDLPF